MDIESDSEQEKPIDVEALPSAESEGWWGVVAFIVRMSHLSLNVSQTTNVLQSLCHF